MRVPFLDLVAQLETTRTDVERALLDVVASGRDVCGRNDQCVPPRQGTAVLQRPGPLQHGSVHRNRLPRRQLAYDPPVTRSGKLNETFREK